MATLSSWRQIYNTIMGLQSLIPSEQVTQAFSSFLKQVSQSTENELDKSDLTEPEMLQIRERFSKSVFELEKYWAYKILNSENHQFTLEQYPQWGNYLKVIERELNAIRIYLGDLLRRKTLLIGGGPIPLTAIILAQKYNLPSVVLDNDAEAIDLSEKLIIALGLQQQVTIIHSSGENFKTYHEYSLIFVAALAGIHSEEKQRIFTVIKSQSASNTYILTRSSYGSRKLLYLPMDRTIQQQFETIIEIHPDDDVMNSIILLKTAD